MIRFENISKRCENCANKISEKRGYESAFVTSKGWFPKSRWMYFCHRCMKNETVYLGEDLNLYKID